MKKIIFILCLIGLFLVSGCQDNIKRETRTIEINDLKQNCINATIYGIELEIERFPNRTELKEDLLKYKNMNLQDYELPEKREIIYETHSSHFGSERNDVLSESRSGPFYHIVGIRGNNYSIIELETRYKMGFYLVYQKTAYTYPNYYIYLDEWTKTK